MITTIIIMGTTITTAITIMTESISPSLSPLALSRLLQLASPMLPVGAYSYSQGLESAIETGYVRDAATASQWIADVLTLYLGRFELPLLCRMCEALSNGEDPELWNAVYCAGRDTAEGRAETLQMGYSLMRLLRDLDSAAAVTPTDMATPHISFPLAFAKAAVAWKIPADTCVQAYAWSWLENQVAAAMKAIPIGQVAGQRILLAIGAMIPDVVACATILPENDISNFAPGLTLAACRHEVQYSRLFRS